MKNHPAIPLYVYESHLGSLYVSDSLYDIDTLYCDECGDYDTYIGEASTKSEAKKLLKRFYGYYGQVEKEFVKEHWNR